MCLPFTASGQANQTLKFRIPDPRIAMMYPGTSRTRGKMNGYALTRIHLSVAEYASLTPLVTDGHYVSNSALEAFESSSQQRRDTHYAKSPCWVPLTAYQLRLPSQNTPLPGDRETHTHTRVGPTTWRLTGSFRTLAWTLRTRMARSHRSCRCLGSTRTPDACGTRIYRM